MSSKNANFVFSGLDIPKHGEPAYPAKAWGDGWGEFLKASHHGLGRFYANILLDC